MEIEKNTDYWQNLKPPLSPNDYEIDLYKKHIKGYFPVCLLGMTKGLQPFCDYMVDLHPVNQPKTVLNKNWNEFEEYAGAIMGDGVLNLEGLQLAEKLLTRCNKLVCRVFLKKLSCMKYATHKLGFKITEVPITFIDRLYGQSKMSSGIFKEAFFGVWKMRKINFK